MTQSSLPTPNNGLRVFSASLLSALLIMMPFVQLAAAEKRSEVRGQSSQSGWQEADSGRQEQSASKGAVAENVFLNAPVPKPAPEPPALLPVIVATKDDGLAAATTVAPGGTITYTVNINNTHATDNATNVQFSDQIDAHTTLVGDSTVAAVSDKYNTIGNTEISVPDGATDLLGNDFDPDPPASGTNLGMTVTAYGATTGTEQTSMGSSTATAQGGSVTVSANGSFTYNPPLGFEGADTFKYRAADSDGFTAITTVTVTIAGMIWYIKNSGAVGGACASNCDGRLSNPFQTLAAFQAVNNGTGSNPAAGDSIFLFESTTDYVGPVTLLNNQKFIGQDATASLQSITSLTAPSGTDPFPVMNSGNGTFVNITGANVNGINLLSGNTLRGFRVGDVGTGTKISGTSFGTLTVGNNSSPDVLLNGTGRTLNLVTGTFAATSGFVGVASTSSSGQGMTLTTVAGTVSFGSTTISNATTQCMQVSTSTANINFGDTSCSTATTYNEGIVLSSNGAGTRTFGTLSITGASAGGFIYSGSGSGGGDVTVTGGATINVAGNAISVSAPVNGDLIEFQAATSATTSGLNVAGVFYVGAGALAELKFNSLSITRNNGTALDASGAGIVTVTNGTGTINATIPSFGSAGPAIVASNIALNANFLAINSSGGANAVSLTSVTGTSNFGGGQLTGTASGATFQIAGGTISVTYTGNITQNAAAAMVSVTGGHSSTGAVTFSGTLNAGAGTGLQFINADSTGGGGYIFSGSTTLAGGDAGIDITNGSAGTFSFNANTTITNPSGVAVNVDGGSVGFAAVTGGISIAGSISKNSDGRLIDFNNYDTATAAISATLSCTVLCDGVEVTNNGGSSGIVNFSSATKTLTGAVNAVNLDNNDSGQVNFTGGGLDIDTTSGVGFSATNGGTVTVTTGANPNTIDSTTGTALNVVSTDIGATGLTFRSIAANGASSGIVLNNTGSSGGLTVTGNAGSCTSAATCTGGAIQNTTGDAISLTSTQSPSFSFMNITGTNGNGINATSLTAGLTLTSCAVINTGDGDNDNALKLLNVSGTVSIQGSTFNNTAEDMINIDTTSVSPNNADMTLNVGTVTACTFTQPNTLAGIRAAGAFAGNGILIAHRFSKNYTFNISNSTFTDIKLSGFQFGSSGSTSTATNCNVNITNNQFQVTINNAIGNTNNRANFINVQGLNTIDIDASITGNTLNKGGGGGIQFGADNGANVSANVTGNTVTNQFADGILMAVDESATLTVLIDGNTITNTSSDGMELANAISPDALNATLNATITNNTVTNYCNNSGLNAFVGGIAIFGGASAGDNTRVDVRNNNVSGSPSASFVDYWIDGSSFGDQIDMKGPGIAAVTEASFLAQPNTAGSPAGQKTFIGNTFYNNNAAIPTPVLTPLALSSGGVEVAFPTVVLPLTQAELNTIVAAAKQRWMISGLTANQTLAVERLQFEIADLDGAYLGEANGDQILIDVDGGGKGWFVDSTPEDDCEFDSSTSPTRLYATPFSAAAGRIDLLTAIEHEIGHKLGVGDQYAGTDRDSIMYGYLSMGERRLPTKGQAASALPGGLKGTHYLSLKEEARDNKSEVKRNHATTSRAVTPAVSGETVTANIGTLPAGGSVTITFQVTVNNPPNLTLLGPPRVENQGTVTFNEVGSPVLTDDPNVGGAADKTATQIDLYGTTTSVITSGSPSNQGDPVTFTATVATNNLPFAPPGGTNPTGTVQFLNGVTPLTCTEGGVNGIRPVSGGTAACTTSALTSAGSPHTINANYSGDGNFDSSSGNVSQTVIACVTNPVVTSTADPGDGSCATGGCTLREAITEACNGSTITFDTAGAFNAPQTITLNGTELSVGRNVTIDGPDAAINHVTVSGNNASRVFNINSGKTVTIRELTITGGHSGSNGAIRTDGGILTLRNSTVSGNNGGGIFTDASGSVTVLNSTINGNTAPGGGAAIYCDNSSTLNVTNSTISGNSTPGSGGGVATYNGCTATIINATITLNFADSEPDGVGAGGGIFNGSGTVTLHNTIVAGNFNEDGATDARDDVIGALDAASSNNLIGDGTGMTGITHGNNGNQVGTGGSPIDAMLGALANNGGPTQTHRLLPASSAIDAGNNAQVTNPPFSGPPFTDQRQLARIVDGPDGDTTATVDIGSVEVNYLIAATAGTPQSAAIGTAFATALGATVSESGIPIGGVSVTFTAPGAGASGTFAGSGTAAETVTTNGSGVATASTFTANNTAGSYTVSATATGYNGPADFSLTNNAATTTITTQVSTATTTVGSPVSDTATLAGGVNPTGTITFTVYGPNDATCAGAAVFTSAAIPVNGNGNYGSGNFTPTAPGTYRWIATYSGDANNSGVAGMCNDANETVTVGTASPTMTTTASAGVAVGGNVSDTATIAGGFNPTGSITFRLYGPNDATCAGAPIFTSAAIPVNGNGNYGSGNFGSTMPGTYRWIASYTGDSNNAGVTGMCNDANESVVVSQAGPTLTTLASAGVLLGGAVSDDATLTGGFNPTGTITFTLYGPNDATCGGAPVFTSAAIPVAGNGTYSSGNFTPTAAGTYRWIATYSGDANNSAVAGMCNDANESVNVGVDVSVNDASVAEPVSPNTVDMVFTVALSAPASGNITVDFNVANGTANSGTCNNPGADYTPTSGQVNFTSGQQVKTINLAICSDADNAEVDETLTVTLSNATGATINDGTATGTIKVAADPAGAVLISELRTSGPGGAGDDFVEIYNNSNSPKDISGYGLFKMGADCNATPVLIAAIPGAPGSNTTVIPARGHYLMVGSAYSLTNYGGTGAAAGNLTFSSDIETDANVGLFSTSNVTGISSVNRLDAVGFGANVGGTCNLLREATPLPPIAGNATLQHSYFRKMCDWIQGSGCTVPGIPKDTNNNANDFWLADTTGSPTTGRLGAPGPENLASPIRRDNANNPGSGGINVVLLDGTVGSAANPNRNRNGGDPEGTFGSMTLRYRVTNNTAGNVTRLRYRVVDISTAIQPAGTTADLRAITVLAQTVSPVNDPVTCTAVGAGPTPCTVFVTGTTLEAPPNQAIGGGYNSTLSSGTVTSGTPIAPGGTILINFKLGVEKTGAFRFYIIVEALP